MKRAHTVFDTPVHVAPSTTIGEALNLLPKRAHGLVVVVSDGEPVGPSAFNVHSAGRLPPPSTIFFNFRVAVFRSLVTVHWVCVPGVTVIWLLFCTVTPFVHDQVPV